MHLVPTDRSWLNQVDRFFTLITDTAIRRGSLNSAKQLVQHFDHFVAPHNANRQPFKRTDTADSSLKNLPRLLLTYQEDMMRDRRLR